MPRLLEQLAPALDRIRAGESAEKVAAEVWPDFTAAVAWAVNDLQAEEAAGVRRWREARHEGDQE